MLPTSPRTTSTSARALPAAPATPREDESHEQRWRRLSQGAATAPFAARTAALAAVRARVWVRVPRVDATGADEGAGAGAGAVDAREAAYFRSRIARAIARRVAPVAGSEGDDDAAALVTEMDTTDVPPPAHMPRTLVLCFHLRLGGGVPVQPVTVACARFQCLKEALLRALEIAGVRGDVAAVLARCAVRTHGHRCYALRDDVLTTPLEHICHVRECALRRRPLAFVVESSLPARGTTRAAAPSKSAGGTVEDDSVRVQCIPLSAVPQSVTLGVTVVAVDVLPPDIVPRGVAGRGNFVDAGITFAVALAVHYRGAPFVGSGGAATTSARTDGTWAEYVETGVPLAVLPREARLVATLVLRQRARAHAVAWAAATLFDENGVLRAGALELRMWRGAPPPPHAPGPAVAAAAAEPVAIRLLVRLAPADPPLYWDHGDHGDHGDTALATSEGSKSGKNTPGRDLEAEAVRLLRAGEVGALSAAERALVWACREGVRLQQPDALPALLACVPWDDAGARAAVPRLVARWPRLAPVRALALLDAAHADTAVRAFAVACLDALDDAPLLDLLPPLVQALKHEPHHYSALAEFLLVRALRSRLGVGQTLYWLLQAEVHVAAHRARYALLADAYLGACGAQRVELSTQLALARQLAAVQQRLRTRAADDAASGISSSGSSSSSTAAAAVALPLALAPLTQLKWLRLSLPTDPSVLVKEIVPADSRLMKSAMRPLWITLASADPVPAPATSVIFKVGDDLRQDMLVLNAFSLMDRLWKQDGLDLRLSVFRCIPTGRDAGFVEVVPNAQTMAQIQRAANGLTGALRATSLRAWLEAKNPDPDALATAVANFTLSCAGYCVATFVLGIGDRHNDNIMVDHAGHLFHIDFAFFMGKTVKFGFYDREKAPFVLTNGLCFSSSSPPSHLPSSLLHQQTNPNRDGSSDGRRGKQKLPAVCADVLPRVQRAAPQRRDLREPLWHDGGVGPRGARGPREPAAPALDIPPRPHRRAGVRALCHAHHRVAAVQDHPRQLFHTHPCQLEQVNTERAEREQNQTVTECVHRRWCRRSRGSGGGCGGGGGGPGCVPAARAARAGASWPRTSATARARGRSR